VPAAVAEAVAARGRRVVLFGITGWADRAALERYTHYWVRLGQFGRFLRLARAEGCHDVVLIGSLLRPSLWQLRFDWRALRELPRVLRAFRGGDDHLLSGMARLLEDNGFHLLGAQDVAPEILMPSGILGRTMPDAQAQADIARGLALLAATSPFDVGQAAIVANGHVVALEAAEGTDLMLERVVTLRQEGRIQLAPDTGVLIKAPKTQQDLRFDLPALGPKTVEGAAQAKLAGIAVVAGATVVAEIERVRAAADANNLFVVGINPDSRG
jgi:DUF1009 family protein